MKCITLSWARMKCSVSIELDEIVRASSDVSLEALLADVKTFVNGSGLRDDATGILIGTRQSGYTN